MAKNKAPQQADSDAQTQKPQHSQAHPLSAGPQGEVAPLVLEGQSIPISNSIRGFRRAVDYFPTYKQKGGALTIGAYVVAVDQYATSTLNSVGLYAQWASNDGKRPGMP